MIRALGVTEVAARTGLSVDTIKSYGRDGIMPPADVMIGRTKGWTAETIDAWSEGRPGKVGRPRKKIDPTT
ncbi:helix-turn-helix transcriptional regulator [Gordonia sp. NPDC003376]